MKPRAEQLPEPRAEQRTEQRAQQPSLPGMSANEITNRLLLTIPEQMPHVRVWRRNVGAAYPAATVNIAIGLIRQGKPQDALAWLIRSRPVTFGVPGEPDIDGIAGPNGIRIGIEVKAGSDRLAPIQKNFADMLVKRGGVHLVARSVETTIEELASLLERVK